MSEQTVQPEVLTWDTPDRLRKALRAAGVGVGEMADYLGVTRNTVGNYLSGRTQADVRTMRLWAFRCGNGVTFEWLQTGQPGNNGPSPDRGSTRRYPTVTSLPVNHTGDALSSGSLSVAAA